MHPNCSFVQSHYICDLTGPVFDAIIKQVYIPQQTKTKGSHLA